MKTTFITLILLLTFFLSCEKDDSIEPIINTDYTISVDEEFNIELISNQTTGYRWQWTNSDKIQIVDTTNYYYVVADTNLDGEGGKEIWTFKGLKIGLDSIKMEYNQSWTPDSTIDSKTIVVEVK